MFKCFRFRFGFRLYRFLKIEGVPQQKLDGVQAVVEVVVVALGGVELLAHIVGLLQRIVALLHSVGRAVVGVLRGTLGMGGTALALLLGGEGLLYGVERLLGGGAGVYAFCPYIYFE